ncbi:ThiF family adenylyltransferase [Olivibacter sp. SA151]|uniref:ThiF family adenylyltransferase n=1 Tax=Olivibacter jilunii TaxID=985016 RepID=UPI003F154084
MGETRQEAVGNNFRPIIFRRRHLEDSKEMDKLLAIEGAVQIIDTIDMQLAELIKIENPSESFDEKKLRTYIDAYIYPSSSFDFGAWVYYPWLNKIIHLLDEPEFVKVRTSRNIYKIKPEEINVLKEKKVGIVGLSVGQSIALTLAMERSCGELRLADFDSIELSNMNRIRVGVQDLGQSKVITAARQIAELDPYIKVLCFTDGLDTGNMDQFLLEGGKLDMLVEECDGIDIKIISRLKARAYGIPVIMDTNDKGMLDIERFDLERDRPILHGRLQKIEGYTIQDMEIQLKELDLEQKIAYLVDIIGFENVSEAMKLSLHYMKKTIIGWPQLASAVTLGGAMVTDVVRRVFLDQFNDSGRYFVDFEELIHNTKVD